MILDSPIVTGSVLLSGSFTVTGGNVIGNLTGTASNATTSLSGHQQNDRQ